MAGSELRQFKLTQPSGSLSASPNPVSGRLNVLVFGSRPIAKFLYALAGLFVFAFALYLAAVFMDAMKFRRQVRAAGQIEVGDTAATVRQVLGEPRMLREKGVKRLFGSPYERETWSYDWWLRPEFYAEWPYFFPIAFKFDPLNTDLLIEFDDRGRVYSIALPE